MQFNLQASDAKMVGLILECPETTLPVTYLGMPLTTKKPTRLSFMPLIEKMESRLQGWSAKLISRGGRMQLVNSVLSSIPVYYMNCFRLPKWVIKRMDKVRRLFLWGKGEQGGRGISLLNWESVLYTEKVGWYGSKTF